MRRLRSKSLHRARLGCGDVKVEGDCTTDRVVAQVCEICGEIGEDEVTAAPGHTEVVDAAVAATCEATGLTEGSHCSVCGEVLVAQETVAIIDHIYENGSCTMCGKAEPVIPFKVGDIVIFTGSMSDGTKYELSEFGSSAKYGTAAKYTDVPAGTFLITVVEGNQSGTFAFKNGNNYIALNGSDLKLSETLDDDASWLVELDEGGNLVIKSYSKQANMIQFNASSPRFKTYTSKQQPIKVIKVPTLITVGASLNTGVKIRVTYNIPQAWLDDNAGAKVVFTCEGETKEFDAVSGSNTYYVNLASHLISKAITVQIVDREGNALTASEAVSLSIYRAKLEAADLETLKMTENQKEKALALIDAALTHSDYASGALTEDIELTDEEFVASGVVNNFDGTITVKANLSAKIKLIIGITSETAPTVTVDGQAVECDFTNNVLTIGGLYHTKFNDEIVISVGETEVLKFTFNSYLKAIYSSGALDKNLAAATYLYGVAAEAYISAE